MAAGLLRGTWSRPSSNTPAPPAQHRLPGPGSPPAVPGAVVRKFPGRLDQRARRRSWLPAVERGGGCDAITFGRRPGAVWPYLARLVNRDVKDRRDSKVKDQR
jgi:hypothetical protein